MNTKLRARLCKLLVLSTLIFGLSFGLLASDSSAGLFGRHHCCDTCCEPCPPPPVTQELCVVDPCTGCTYKVCVKVPACCADEAPCMTWRWGIFGRKVLTYKWSCCGHCVDVVITKFGRTIVRG